MLLEQVPEAGAELYRLATTVEASDFRERALESMKSHVHFDSAVWGNFAWVNNLIEERDFYTHNVPRELIENHGENAKHDPLTKACFNEPGKTFLSSAEELPAEAKVLRDKIDKFDLGFAMATCVILPKTGLIHAMNLMRNRQGQKFSEDERQFKQAIMPHLVESLRQNHQLQIRRELLRHWEQNHCTATANAQGVLFEIEDKFLDLLLEEWPGWEGARLPEPLVKHIAANQQWQYQGKHIVINADARNDHCLMIAGRPGPFNSLSPREQEIAHLFAHGKTHKQIAEQLCISPATARNHVASVYGKLDVNNKTDLLNRLAE